jgi:hypothetical protein
MNLSFLTNPTTQTVLEVYIAFMIASAFVQSLPDPSNFTGFGGIMYRSFYNFCSVIVTDFKSFVKTPPAGVTTTNTATLTTNKSTEGGS